jgi:hypothetical protein
MLWVLCVQVPSASAYLALLQQQGIQLDFEARRQAIWQGAAAAAAEVRLQDSSLHALAVCSIGLSGCRRIYPRCIYPELGCALAAMQYLYYCSWQVTHRTGSHQYPRA